MKNLLLAATILIVTGCAASEQRSINASLYADKVVTCTGSGLQFTLEGSSRYGKGYIQVNGSDRIDTVYEDSGVEATWWWGKRVEAGSSKLTHGNYNYRVIVAATSEGWYVRTDNDPVSLTCKNEQ